jgi:hypothetical protein
MIRYAEFAAREEALAKRGINGHDIGNTLDGNYLRVLGRCRAEWFLRATSIQATGERK